MIAGERVAQMRWVVRRYLPPSQTRYPAIFRRWTSNPGAWHGRHKFVYPDSTNSTLHQKWHDKNRFATPFFNNLKLPFPDMRKKHQTTMSMVVLPCAKKNKAINTKSTTAIQPPTSPNPWPGFLCEAVVTNFPSQLVDLTTCASPSAWKRRRYRLHGRLPGVGGWGCKFGG